MGTQDKPQPTHRIPKYDLNFFQNLFDISFVQTFSKLSETELNEYEVQMVADKKLLKRKIADVCLMGHLFSEE